MGARPSCEENVQAHGETVGLRQRLFFFLSRVQGVIESLSFFVFFPPFSKQSKTMAEEKKDKLTEAMEERVKEYEMLFGTSGNAGNAAKKLKERGLSCGLKDTKLRSVVWEVFLEVLPPYVSVNEWPARIQASRKEYDALCEKFVSKTSLFSLSSCVLTDVKQQVLH